MKAVKAAAIAVALMIPLALAVYAAGPKVSRVEADKQVDLSGHWNDSDIRMVCDSLIEDALSSPRIDRYIKDFQDKNDGALPTVIIGNIANESSERMNTGIIARIMRTAIINSGKLDFVEGGAARSQLRAERQEQQSNASEDTAAALADEVGANFMLQGTVDMVEDEAIVGGKKVRVNAYFVRVSLTDVARNTILWEGENNEIKKVISQSKRKL